MCGLGGGVVVEQQEKDGSEWCRKRNGTGEGDTKKVAERRSQNESREGLAV